MTNPADQSAGTPTPEVAPPHNPCCKGRVCVLEGYPENCDCLCHPRPPEPDTPSAEPGADALAKAREVVGWYLGVPYVPDSHPLVARIAAALRASEAALESLTTAVLDDLGDLLEVLGKPNVARPISPHEVMRECIRAVESLTKERDGWRSAYHKVQADRVHSDQIRDAQHAAALESARQEGARIETAARAVIAAVQEQPLSPNVIRDAALAELRAALRGGSPQSSGLPERYARIKDAAWFKAAYEGRSLGDAIPVKGTPEMPAPHNPCCKGRVCVLEGYPENCDCLCHPTRPATPPDLPTCSRGSDGCEIKGRHSMCGTVIRATPEGETKEGE
jgi:hypothetical protein